MTGKEIYKIWAPSGKKWVDWVRPVPFVEIKENVKDYYSSNLRIPVLHQMKTPEKDMAVIVDLPGVESVTMGIALAQMGYRPIPIYNGTIEQSGARATVDNQSVTKALVWGAVELAKLDLPEDAPPAFLTDSNRLHRFKMEPSIFDNSWDVYPQDLPSADYFIQNNIRKILIIGESVSKDLQKILYEFQKKEIEIYLKKPYESEKKVVLRKLRGKKIDKI